MLRKLPDTLVIVMAILLLFTGLTWIIPAGEYDRTTVNGREVVVPDSYHRVESKPQGFFAFLQAPLKGFEAAAEIIAFVFLVGGAFALIHATGAIMAGLQSIIRFSRRRPKYKTAVIPLVMALFSLAGSTFGMSEEVLVFILISMPLAFALGYDSLVGVAMPFVGAGAGFAGAFANPFTIGIAQGIAELPPFSGSAYRIIIWFVFTAIATVYVMRYARRIEKKPELSPMYELDAARPDVEDGKAEHLPLTTRRRIILAVFALSLVLLIYGVNQWGWYIAEIAGLFIGLGLVAAIIGRVSMNEGVSAFTEGAKEMMAAGLVIALSKGILVIAQEGRIIDTVLQAVVAGVGDFPNYISVQVMFIVQSFLNLFLPSGSGQAALTMPIMAPLSDLLGITRQTAVLAFQFGDGLSNMIIPTSGVTMGVLSIAKVPYQKWLRWMLPLFIILSLAAMLFLLGPVLFFHYGPF